MLHIVYAYVVLGVFMFCAMNNSYCNEISSFLKQEEELIEKDLLLSYPYFDLTFNTIQN